MQSRLSEFCREFGVDDVEFGDRFSTGRRHFLITPEQRELLDRKPELRKSLFGVGVYLGEEKDRFEPSPALLELVNARATEHKLVVDEKAAWLILCGRDVLREGVRKNGAPTKSGYLLINDERGENLGYGISPAFLRNARKLGRHVAVKALLDRGFYLRRERFA